MNHFLAFVSYAYSLFRLVAMTTYFYYTWYLRHISVRWHKSCFSKPLSFNKPLSQILTRILTAVKEGLQKNCDTAYARSCVNQMWILKNSKELLENLKAQSLHSVNSIKSFDFSIVYTTIPRDKLKSELKGIIKQSFFHKNGNQAFSMLSLSTKTHTSFGITLMHHKNTQMQMSLRCWNI